MARGISRRGGGQATLELAVMLPILVVLSLGAADLGRIVSSAGVAAEQVRVGLRYGSEGIVRDIGAQIRKEAGNAYPDTTAVWGLDSATGADGALCGSATGEQCGDPNACVSSSDFWSAANGSPSACFAVTDCAMAILGPAMTCPQPAAGAWTTRPPPTAPAPATRGLWVRVVLHIAGVLSAMQDRTLVNIVRPVSETDWDTRRQQTQRIRPP